MSRTPGVRGPCAVVPFAARPDGSGTVKRSTARSVHLVRQRARGVERAVLGSVLLVFLSVAVPQYVSYRRMAADIAARTSIRAAVTALESYAGARSTAYDGADVHALAHQGMRIGPNQWVLVASLHDAYWILAQTRGGSGLWVRTSEGSGDHLID